MALPITSLHWPSSWALLGLEILCSQTSPWHLQLCTSQHPCASSGNAGGLPDSHRAPFALEAAWLQPLGLILLSPLCSPRD